MIAGRDKGAESQYSLNNRGGNERLDIVVDSSAMFPLAKVSEWKASELNGKESTIEKGGLLAPATEILNITDASSDVLSPGKESEHKVSEPQRTEGASTMSSE